MNKKTGFTLIELLAVIVILAIVALITVPLIMQTINDAKKGSAKDSMYAYIKGVEISATKSLDHNIVSINGSYKTKDGNLYSDSTKKLDVLMKGTKPADDFGYVRLKNGNVTSALLKFDNIEIKYNGNIAEIYDSSIYNIGNVVYFDPTGKTTDCKEGNEWTSTNTGTTCYKWNIIKNHDEHVELLLDHNIVHGVAAITSGDFVLAGGTVQEFDFYGSNKYGPLTVLKRLKVLTDDWNRVETYTTSDNVTVDASNGYTYTINYNGMKSRLIGAQEVADIGNDKKWTPSQVSFNRYEDKPWLYQNLVSTPESYKSSSGYWTDSAVINNVRRMWFVSYRGSLDNIEVYNSLDYGIRPVVKLSKSNI